LTLSLLSDSCLVPISFVSTPRQAAALAGAPLVVSDEHLIDAPAETTAPAAPSSSSAAAAVATSAPVRLRVHAHDIGPVRGMRRNSCDVCRASIDPNGSFRCTRGCDYDVCTACFARLRPERLPSHAHAIGPVDGMERHRCDECRGPINPRGSFRCVEGCDFDVCQSCWDRHRARATAAAAPKTPGVSFVLLAVFT
jgi:hypothetical protein